MDYKVGLVLPGGGGKGAYQIGVWKALAEFGIDKKITAVSGTSVGALNAALFMEGDYEKAERIWSSIDMERILTKEGGSGLVSLIKLLVNSYREGFSKAAHKSIDDIMDKMKKRPQSIFSRDGLFEIIRENLDLATVSASPILGFATCKPELPKSGNSTEEMAYFKLNGLSEERLLSILLASSALPIIFEPEEIGGTTYRDGGLYDNVPVRPLYKAGCNLIIIAHLSNKHNINEDEYPGCTFVHILPRKSLGGRIGTLDFTRDGIKQRMEQGYQEAKKLFEQAYALSQCMKRDDSDKEVDRHIFC